jgi:DNA-binding winged helix-turn-helix (wHTH) protein/tetratricopeptide (TPR) repeat protein
MVFAFGDYELDTERIELRQTGRPLAVEPQVFDVLVYLVVNRSRVVTKNELLDHVWGDRFVSESALTSRIKAARRLVGDDGRTQHVIRTSHGRGYRFVAEVTEMAEADASLAAVTPAPAVPVATGATATSSSGAEHGSISVEESEEPARRVGGTRWPLVGRGLELERVARWYSDRRVGAVLLSGAAGLGKTRLAEECLAAARCSAVSTARVTGNPEASSVSLGALAHLVSPDIVALVGPDGELDRTTLFHRARVAISGLVPDGERLMMLVDDVDQLDELSRALIGSLIVDGAVFAVLTVRSGRGPVPSIDHLDKEGRLRRLELTELGREMIEVLLYRVLGGPMVTESLVELVDASLGNPGILRQLVSTARDSGVLVESHGVWHLTGPLQPNASLEVLVADRLSGIDGEARHAVELLAVAGELGLDLLVDLVGVDAVDEVDRLGVVSLRVSDRRNDLTLAHPLYGEVVRRGLSLLHGRRLRRELADAIDALGARRRDDETRIVAWRLDGGGQIEAGSLVRAARLALIDHNLDVAQRLLDKAFATDPTPEVVQLLAELHFRLGDTGRVEALLAGIDLAAVDDHRRAAIARRRANNQFFGTTDYERSFAILTDAIEGVTDPEVRRSLEAALAQLLANGGQITAAIDWAEQTLVGANGPVRLEALRAYGLALLAAGRVDDALVSIRAGRTLHAEINDDVELPGLTMLLFSEAVALAEIGQVDRGREAVAAARREHPRGQMTWLDTALGRVELLAGHPRAVRQAVAPVVHEARVRGMGSAERWVLALHACAWLLEGDVASAVPELERVAELEDGPRGLFHPDIDRAHAWLAAYRGDLDEAVERLSWSRDEARGRGAHGFECTLVHDLVRFGAGDPWPERLAELAGSLQGAVASARALFAQGVVASDPELLAQAAARFERCGARVYAAEAGAATAVALDRAGRSDEARLALARVEQLRSVDGVRLVSPGLPER